MTPFLFQKFPSHLLFLVSISLGSILLVSCGGTKENIRVPARELYNKGTIAYEDSFYTEAVEKFTKLTTEHPGTRLATLSHLMLGNLNFDRKKWDEAETNYQIFLQLNPKSNLTPFVLNRLIQLNYERNLYGFFFPRTILRSRHGTQSQDH